MARSAVLGTGVIGGSIALRLAAAGSEVVAYDPDAETRAAVADAGIEVADDPAAAARTVDLVVIATPVDQIAPLCDVLAAGGADAVVTDVGSAKGIVVAAATRALGDRFVGGHPMAGSERHGFGAADPSLFEDAPWILTPTEATDQGVYRKVSALVTLLGARPVALDPEAHDRLMARLSHLPQLAASAVVQAAVGAGDEDALLGLAAGGFRDVTRIAASRPEMWVPILRANRAGVIQALDRFGAKLSEVRDLLETEDWDGLSGFLADARAARLGMFARPDHSEEPVTLTLLIPDRPGVLAEVTTAAGELGVNIEDVKIFHSTEGGRGRLELVVTGSRGADLLATRLDDFGYHVDRGLPE